MKTVPVLTQPVACLCAHRSIMMGKMSLPVEEDSENPGLFKVIQIRGQNQVTGLVSGPRSWVLAFSS